MTINKDWLHELLHEHDNCVDESVFDAIVEELDKRDSEINGYKASRIAYASEFPSDSNGDPDVGNIHANIRKLKAKLAEYARQINGW